MNAIKTFYISPQTMLKIAGGAEPVKMNVPVSRDAVIVNCGWNSKTEQFWIDVRATSFFDEFSAVQRMPNGFHILAS